MFQLPHWIEALASFYGCLAVLFGYCAHKPSCRNCLYRHACPSRRHGLSQLLLNPICITLTTPRQVDAGDAPARCVP